MSNNYFNTASILHQKETFTSENHLNCANIMAAEHLKLFVWLGGQLDVLVKHHQTMIVQKCQTCFTVNLRLISQSDVR